MILLLDCRGSLLHRDWRCDTYATYISPLLSHLTNFNIGDGNKGLEKEWQGAAEMSKSKSMSAKNAWGKSTGYADELIEKGVDTARAQVRTSASQCRGN